MASIPISGKVAPLPDTASPKSSSEDTNDVVFTASIPISGKVAPLSDTESSKSSSEDTFDVVFTPFPKERSPNKELHRESAPVTGHTAPLIVQLITLNQLLDLTQISPVMRTLYMNLCHARDGVLAGAQRVAAAQDLSILAENTIENFIPNARNLQAAFQALRFLQKTMLTAAKTFDSGQLTQTIICAVGQFDNARLINDMVTFWFTTAETADDIRKRMKKSSILCGVKMIRKDGLTPFTPRMQYVGPLLGTEYRISQRLKFVKKVQLNVKHAVYQSILGMLQCQGVNSDCFEAVMANLNHIMQILLLIMSVMNELETKIFPLLPKEEQTQLLNASCLVL